MFSVQSIRQCVKHLALYGRAIVNNTDVLSSTAKTLTLVPTCSFHLSSGLYKSNSLSKYKAPTVFLRHNRTIFPPQKLDEERRPAVSCIMQKLIKLIIDLYMYTYSFSFSMYAI